MTDQDLWQVLVKLTLAIPGIIGVIGFLLVILTARGQSQAVKRASRSLACLTIGGALLSLCISIGLVWLYLPDTKRYVDFSLRLIWRLDIHIDALSLFFLLLVNVVSLLASLSSWHTVEDTSRRNRKRETDDEGNDEKNSPANVLQTAVFFHFSVNMFHFTMVLVALVDNLVWLWIAIELTTLFSALTVGYHRLRSNWEAAWKYLIITSTGIILALLGTMFLANAVTALLHSSDANIQAVMRQAVDANGNPQDMIMNWTFLMTLARQGGFMEGSVRFFVVLSFLFIVVGYGTKAGLAPMHTWLPDGHGEAPAPMSALLSGVLLKAAFYGILRFYTLTNAAIGESGFTSAALVVAGLFSLSGAVPFILKENPFKRVLAYHSLEHMGIIVLGVGLAGLLGSGLSQAKPGEQDGILAVAAITMFGALLHSFNHAITKSLMFLAYGNVTHAYGLPKSGVEAKNEPTGILRNMPLTGGILILGGLALVGMPPFNIFMSEFIIVWGALQALLLGIFPSMLDWRALLTMFAIGIFIAASNGFCGHCGQPPREAEIRRLWSQSS